LLILSPIKAPLGRPNADYVRKGTTSSIGEHRMAWVILFLAGLLEMAWALLLKQSEGFTRPAPTVGFVITLFLSMFLLAQALKTLPVGTAYAVWTGIGAAGTAIVGMVWLGESRDVLKLVSLMLLVAGIIGMRVTSSH
jgi:quaternary ammonium compound-resistance protein SugE